MIKTINPFEGNGGRKRIWSRQDKWRHGGLNINAPKITFNLNEELLRLKGKVVKLSIAKPNDG